LNQREARREGARIEQRGDDTIVRRNVRAGGREDPEGT